MAGRPQLPSLHQALDYDYYACTYHTDNYGDDRLTCIVQRMGRISSMPYVMHAALQTYLQTTLEVDKAQAFRAFLQASQSLSLCHHWPRRPHERVPPCSCATRPLRLVCLRFSLYCQAPQDSVNQGGSHLCGGREPRLEALR